MKRRRERAAALKAVQDVDVTLPEPTEDAIFDDEMLKAKPPEKARMELAKLRSSKLNCAPQTLPAVPGIDVLSMAIRYLPGGRKSFLSYVKLAAQNGDVVAHAWWTVYADLTPSSRHIVNYGDVCFAAGVKPSALLASMVGHGVEASKDVAELMAASLHPAVIAAAGKSALRIDGPDAAVAAEDRKHFLQASGFIPPTGKSGPVVQVNTNASANSQAAAASVSQPSVPKFAADLQALAEPRQSIQKQLAQAAPPPPDTEDADFEETA